MAKAKIGRMVVGMMQTNCYFIYNSSTKEAVVADPAAEGAKIYENLSKNGFTVKAILLTHGHFDHIGGVEELKKLSGALVYASEKEAELCGNPDLNISAQTGRAFGIKPDRLLKDGDVLNIGGMTLEVIATPGHTSGGLSFYLKDEGILISGDTLFLESIGRTDFPTGSMSTLIRSVKERIFVLADEVKIYPGHGDSTTVGHEKSHNPFCV